MTTALDLVEGDLLVLTATTRAVFAMLARHPNYGRIDVEGGEVLSDAGTILIDTAKRLEAVFEKLDGQELASCPA